jgi:hypothetical protein
VVVAAAAAAAAAALGYMAAAAALGNGFFHIFPSFHYSTYFSSIFSISFHISSTCSVLTEVTSSQEVTLVTSPEVTQFSRPFFLL